MPCRSSSYQAVPLPPLRSRLVLPTKTTTIRWWLRLLYVPVSVATATATATNHLFSDVGTKSELSGGVFLGDEKYYTKNGTLTMYCAQVAFQSPRRNNFLNWWSVKGACEEHVDVMTGEFKGDWLGKIALDEVVVETVEETECTTDNDNDNDHDQDHDTLVLGERDEGDYDYLNDHRVVAVSSGRNFKRDHTNNGYYCDHWQVALLERKATSGPPAGVARKINPSARRRQQQKQQQKQQQRRRRRRRRQRNREAEKMKKEKKSKSGSPSRTTNDSNRGNPNENESTESESVSLSSPPLKKTKKEDDRHVVVLTIAYGEFFTDLSLPRCPPYVTYHKSNILREPNMTGSARLVLQGNLTGSNITNPCTWDCYHCDVDEG